MAEETNVMIEAGRATGDHPLEEQYRIEREIQLRGSQEPDKFEMPGGIGTLADVQKRNEEVQRKEGEEQTTRFRDSMREQSLLGSSLVLDLVVTDQGILLDHTEPVPEDAEVETHEEDGEIVAEDELDQAHKGLEPQTQTPVSEAETGPDTVDRSGGPGGSEGAGTHTADAGPSSTVASGVEGGTT